MNKFFEENCLLEQAYVKDNTKNVLSLIKEYNKANSTNIELNLFHRFHLGDEKK